jgi:hypothetical protein
MSEGKERRKRARDGGRPFRRTGAYSRRVLQGSGTLASEKRVSEGGNCTGRSLRQGKHCPLRNLAASPVALPRRDGRLAMRLAKDLISSWRRQKEGRHHVLLDGTLPPVSECIPVKFSFSLSSDFSLNVLQRWLEVAMFFPSKIALSAEKAI